MKLSVKGLALGFGVIEAFAAFVVWMLSALFGAGSDIIGLASKFYIGFDTTFSGLLWGVIWGFAVGFVAGALVAWVYNFFAD